MTIHAKTKQSVVLHSGPSLKAPTKDELEPGYPLVVLGYQYVRDEAVEFAHVKVLPKGPRTDVQYGYIRSSLIVEDPKPESQPVPPRPAPKPEPLFRTAEWKAIGIAFGVLALIAIAIWII